jgi:basic membrane protein A
VENGCRTEQRDGAGADVMIRMLLLAGLLQVSMTVMAGSALARDFVPALLYSADGKHDKSFNEAAYYGAERFKQRTGIDYLEHEVGPRESRADALRSLVRKGATVIVALGVLQSAAVAEVAAEYPQVKFVLIDGEVDAPNVQSIQFKEQEGSFLVGILAAMASKTHKVGFIGGMDLPIIRRFACGYEQGVKHASPETEVLEDMTGTTEAAWSNPERGAALARAQFAKGVDVVFAAAGATGLGVYQAAKDAGRLAIGVDINQNNLQPGTMLTSMVKLVDVAVELSFSNAEKGNWHAGRTVLGLAEGAVGWSLDEANRALITADMQKAVEAADQAIVDGEIQVADYTVGRGCLY